MTNETKPGAVDRYLIRKGGYYYRPNAQGYTGNKAEAGRYTLEEAISYSHPNGPNGPRDGISYELDTTAQSQPAATVQEVQTGNIVDRDAARLALFNAIRAIKIGNSDDDKLILDNLRKSGFWICRIGDFGSTVAAATRTLSSPASQSVEKEGDVEAIALAWLDRRVAPEHPNDVSAFGADDMVDAFMSGVDYRRSAVTSFANALERGDFANVSFALNQRMCCNGHMCGCRGATVGEYLAHELSAALSTLPHKEEATPAPMGEQGEIEGEKRAFNLGYLIAVSNLVNMHDDTVAAEDLLRALGCSKAEMERFDLTDYDRKPLRRLFREMARKDAHRRATPATTERGRG